MMIGETLKVDEKTQSKIDMLGLLPRLSAEEESHQRAGVTVADLIHAASNGFAMIVRYVLMAGIDPNEKDEEGRTAINVAATREIREILIEAGASLN